MHSSNPRFPAIFDPLSYLSIVWITKADGCLTHFLIPGINFPSFAPWKINVGNKVVFLLNSAWDQSPTPTTWKIKEDTPTFYPKYSWLQKSMRNLRFTLLDVRLLLIAYWVLVMVLIQVTEAVFTTPIMLNISRLIHEDLANLSGCCGFSFRFCWSHKSKENPISSLW